MIIQGYCLCVHSGTTRTWIRELEEPCAVIYRIVADRDYASNKAGQG